MIKFEQLPEYGSDTSKAAAEAAKEGAAADRARVFAFLHEQGAHGATDDEMEVALGICHQTVSARRNGLVQSFAVRDSGLRRKTRRNRDAIVWVVGEGVPIDGAPNDRAPTRPTRAELKDFLQYFRPLSEAEIKLQAWIRHLVSH